MHSNLFLKRHFIGDVLTDFVFIRYSDKLYIIHRNIKENFLTFSHLPIIYVENYCPLRCLELQLLIFYFGMCPIGLAKNSSVFQTYIS